MIIPVMIVRSPCFSFFFFRILIFYEEIKKRGEIAGGFPARKIGSRENFARKKKKRKKKKKKTRTSLAIIFLNSASHKAQLPVQFRDGHVQLIFLRFSAASEGQVSDTHGAIVS